LKDIAQAKQREYQKFDADYKLKEQQYLRPQIKVPTVPSLYECNRYQKEQASFETLLNDGFITRIEALNHLVQEQHFRCFPVLFTGGDFILIELMPVISKTFYPRKL
jgi:hypothetical protein